MPETVERTAVPDRFLAARMGMPDMPAEPESTEATITISLEIENAYELYDDVTTYETDVTMPAPPADEDSQEYEDWAYTHIFALTGVGHEDGDSWYDVTVTACSDPALIGRTFEWGY